MDESVLSRVSALRTALHAWIYRPTRDGNAELGCCLEYLPGASEKGVLVAAELAALSALLGPLSELLTAESEAGVHAKLAGIREPRSEARWAWETATGCEVRFEYKLESG